MTPLTETALLARFSASRLKSGGRILYTVDVYDERFSQGDIYHRRTLQFTLEMTHAGGKTAWAVNANQSMVNGTCIWDKTKYLTAIETVEQLQELITTHSLKTPEYRSDER